jgi:hypothetical protein
MVGRKQTPLPAPPEQRPSRLDDRASARGSGSVSFFFGEL